MTSTGLMHNPPHPGEFIRDVYLGALQVRVRDVASVPISVVVRSMCLR